MNKTHRKEIAKYEYTVKVPFLDMEFNRRDLEKLSKKYKEVPDVLLEEYVNTLQKLQKTENRIKENTDLWIKTQKKIIEYDKVISKIITNKGEKI